MFFAVDNSVFSEDTADGKCTTHGTITAVYQKADAPGEPISPPLHITESPNLTVASHYTAILPCDKPRHKSSDNEGRKKFTINKTGVAGSYKLMHMGWIVTSVISRIKEGVDSFHLPGWAGYNSLLSESKAVTKVGALPLLPEVAHEWPTLLTVMVQARKLKELVIGNDHPAVISFDMALYEKAVQLVDTRPDLKNTVFVRLGELHVVMAALRALGTSIENSGIDDSWIEADVYGSATTRQILKCTHYKRSLTAHIYSYVALYEMAMEEFFKDNPHPKDVCLEATVGIKDACSEVNKHTRAESVKCANTHLLQTLANNDVMNKFQDWEVQRSENAMFRSMMMYLHRVETILFFVAASRNADLNLHLQAGEALNKLYFAMNRIKYKGLWPRYIADMHALKNDHPETWKELELGNISVTKTAIPFVSIGTDHACEHLNKFMKVHSGLIGISNNANARQRFFLASPELSCMANEFKLQFNVKESKVTEHHGLCMSAIKRNHCSISKIKAAIMCHGNPFAVKGPMLYNLITHAYIPEKYVPQILNMDDSGQKLYEDYVAERINGNVGLWAPVKKQNNKMYMSSNKKLAVKIRDKTVDLQETKNLYGRLMVLARSSRDIDQKDSISNYEFTLTPRALFAPSGSLLLCNEKSKLIHALEKLVVAETHSDNSQPASHEMHDVPDEGAMDLVASIDGSHVSRKIAVVDGMVIVQKLTKKKATMATVKDLSECFIEKVMDLTTGYDEIILVFDTYKLDSLKNATRQKRRGVEDPVQ